MANKIFWRIVFDVVGDEVRLQQEITCWSEEPARHHREIIPLNWSTPVGGVTFADDHALFEGGYIQATTADLIAFESATGCLGGEPGERSSTEDQGENVEIRAEVRLDEANVPAPEDGGPGEYPIFYLSQATEQDHVYLGEEVAAGKNRVRWQIARLDYASNAFVLQDGEGWHRVRVSQDLGRIAGDQFGPVFEAVVDSMPVGTSNAKTWPIDVGQISSSENYPAILTPNRLPIFLFDPNPTTFYIGGKPGQGLHGAIGHLEFDPNSSCASCSM